MGYKVCIIGAGPSGLVAAKHLLHYVPKGSFDVTIYEEKNRIGGLWPLEKDDDKGLIHPHMLANQSKHTVQFSDLAWERDEPEFPRAWQVGRYLQRYYDRYCKPAKLHLGMRIVSVMPSSTGSAWTVRTLARDGSLADHAFDRLLVASGYFGDPGISFERVGKAEVPMIHSSKYRDLASLLSPKSGAGAKGGKIVVVGGQMSGVEIASTIATHLSDAIHAPCPPQIENPERYTVHHLTQRPTWVLPLYTSPEPTLKAPPFIPLDLSSNNLANRSQPLVNSQGHISTDRARAVHTSLQNTLGTDQSIFSPSVAISDAAKDDPPYVAVSDYYMEFVRSGLITVSRGKFEYLCGRDVRISSAEVDEITDVAAVVLATGFPALPSIAWMPPTLLEALSVSDDQNSPIALAFHGTHHPSVPGLGFVGFYRAPYWGVMEMQARFLSVLWAAGGPASPSLPPFMAAALKADTSIERAISLRGDPRASQFPMGDYPWLMQEFAAALGLKRYPQAGKIPTLPSSGKEMDILTPARYPFEILNAEQETEIVSSLVQTGSTAWEALTAGKFMARAVFRSLAGRWKLEREIVSALPSHPSGHFSGTADFFLREATREGRDIEYDTLHRAGEHQGLEYLYVEDGQFRASNGLTFSAKRRYIWRYDERKDKLSVWFVKVNKPKMADYLFHEVLFKVPAADDEGGKGSGSGSERGLCARADHLCEQDFYDVDYAFNFQAVNLKDWLLGYRVKGPKKDYTIAGVYTR
ncbi:hypothetical protein QBC37DRAFT_143206 [Rhypophila decipiens]|uniref:DUF6314 domain-containing protein n=1 Tax=Rhypophila decipiens TaxID=261697 RepID=A0AAN6YA24_9PEZI|nr:hypothetical protein QBC37DRAFT_143206 [Rhypophila decipiens]